jgi:hypothetical protein
MTAQQIEILNRLLGETVVGDDDGAFFAFTEARDGDCRNFGHAEAMCRLAASMARQDRAGLVYEDWICPDLLDVLHQASNLSFGVPARISWKVPEFRGSTPNNVILQAANAGRSGLSV